MIDLKNPQLSYLLVSSDNVNALSSYLYSRDYYIVDIQGYYEGKFEDSVLAFTSVDSNELRKDALHILEHFDQECAIVKYTNELVVRFVL